jgi:hypothetical protein
MEKTKSKEITKWFHTVNYDNFSPADFTTIVISLFKQSLKRFRLTLDVSNEQFLKAMVDAVCTFYNAKQSFKPLSGPLRTFSAPAGWTHLCEECWQDMLLHDYFTMDYWDNFWGCCEFPLLTDLFYDIQPFLTAVLPLYVRRSLDLLFENEYILQDDNNEFVRWEPHLLGDEDEEYDSHYSKTKKQRKIMNDMAQ